MSRSGEAGAGEHERSIGGQGSQRGGAYGSCVRIDAGEV